MSEQEAIEKLWECERLGIPLSCELDAFRVAIEALKKQIPTRVVPSKVYENTEFASTVVECPCCHKIINKVQNAKVCDCGQKILWE